nr:hypothetical protein [Actinomycetota bacterium]
VCTVATGLNVSFTRVGTCTLTAKVTAGTDYNGATGTAQSFSVSKATPSAPTITNVPNPAIYGAKFTATVTTNGDGTRSVSSSTPTVCTVATGLNVSFTRVGTCTLTAKVTAGTDYNGATGTAQSFSVFRVGLGYDLVNTDGRVFVFDAPGQHGGFYGSLPGLGITPAAPIVGIAPTTTGAGYFLVGADGGVFCFGSAQFYGSLPELGVIPSKPIVGMVATNTDRGYYLVGADGGVFAFGDVPFLGSLPGLGEKVSNVVGVAATQSGSGYWVVQATGTVTAFGSAKAFPAVPVTSSVSSITGTPTGGGYLLVTQGGGVYSFGNALKADEGTLPHLPLTPYRPVVGIVPTFTTGGYWLIGGDGGVFAFGTAKFYGSLPGLSPPISVSDIVGATPS